MMNTLAELRSFLAANDPVASAALESVVSFEQRDWVTVLRGYGPEPAIHLACLVRPEATEQLVAQPGFDFDRAIPGFVMYGDEVKYLTIGAEDVIPLGFQRTFSDRLPDVPHPVKWLVAPDS